MNRHDARMVTTPELRRANEVEEAETECGMLLLEIERADDDRRELQPEIDRLTAKAMAIAERRSGAVERLAAANNRLLEALKKRARS
jgi:hypothetical protein